MGSETNITVNEEAFLRADDKAAKAAERYAEHVHAMKIYEGASKDYLSSLMMEIRQETTDKKISQSELEMRARADARWLKFRDEQMKQLRESGKREIAYKNAQRRWETIRSMISLKKSEISRNMG